MHNLKAVARNSFDFGSTDLTRMHICIKPGFIPVKEKVRPLNPLQEWDLQRQIDDWAKSGIVEPSNSPWSSVQVPVLKKISMNSSGVLISGL